VLGQNHPNRFSAYLVDHAASHRVLGQQPNRPTPSPFGRRTAHQRHQRRFLAAVQLWLVHAIEALILAQRMLQPTLHIAVRDPRDLASVRTQRRSRCGQRHAPIQHQQRLDATPDSCRPLLACAAPPTQLPPISRRQLQPFKPLPCLHPPL
jgi:hypothetical protein